MYRTNYDDYPIRLLVSRILSAIDYGTKAGRAVICARRKLELRFRLLSICPGSSSEIAGFLAVSRCSRGFRQITLATAKTELRQANPPMCPARAYTPNYPSHECAYKPVRLGPANPDIIRIKAGKD